LEAAGVSDWLRVTRRRPCGVCGKPDWCTVNPALNLTHCMRVESERPSKNSMGGWLHRTDDFVPPRPSVPPPRPSSEPAPDFTSTWRRWFDRTEAYHLDGFAMSLGVDTDALRSLGCAWSGRAWAFPMRDEAGRVVGIRLRGDDGRKWAVTGSKAGLFYPTPPPNSETVYVVEGPTDAAAALTLGLNAVGRASCMGGEGMLSDFCRRQKVRRAVVVADADEAGRRGAERLVGMLRLPACVWTPPCKDLREFVRAGGTAALIQCAVKDLLCGRGMVGR
jgi:hypothetical protein